MDDVTAEFDYWIHEILLPYALLGWEEWQGVDYELRQVYEACLENNLADRDTEVRQVITSNGNVRFGERFPLLPMPKSHNGFERAFFLPSFETTSSGPSLAAFDLFLIVKDVHCLAFRWELGHDPPTTHNYSHVQFCRLLARKELSIPSLLEWMPDEYPAFPINASTALDLFICMATAVHGLDGGILQLIEERVFKSEPGPREKYLKKFRNHINI